MTLLPTDYTDSTVPTGVRTELPASTSRGINAINAAINANTQLLSGATSGVAIVGGTLNGVTIGATTIAPSITATTLKRAGSIAQSGSTLTQWLNQTDFLFGTNTGGGDINYLEFNDEIVGDNHYIVGLHVLDNISTPAVGLRNAIFGEVRVNSAGTNTQSEASYVGVQGRATIVGGLNGTSGTPIGTVWGGWFIGSLAGGTHLLGEYGVEIDMYVAAGSDVQYKYGLAVGGVSNGGSNFDAVRGTVDDIFICLGNQGSSCVKWRNGIMFGFNQGASTGSAHLSWPFASDSTLIGTCVNDGSLPALIGIDFSGVTFSGPAIKLPAASIAMGGMASAPSAITGYGQLYVSTDGNLYFESASGNITRLTSTG